MDLQYKLMVLKTVRKPIFLVRICISNAEPEAEEIKIGQDDKWKPEDRLKKRQ
jgi:hypothetical protein